MRVVNSEDFGDFASGHTKVSSLVSSPRAFTFESTLDSVIAFRGEIRPKAEKGRLRSEAAR